MLPTNITTEVVREISDVVDGRDPGLQNQVADHIDVYIEAVVSEVAEQFNLSGEQIEELEDRICWRLELLPPKPYILDNRNRMVAIYRGSKQDCLSGISFQPGTLYTRCWSEQEANDDHGLEERVRAEAARIFAALSNTE